MGVVVNLRAARKRAKRREDEERAAANRLAYGQTKEERNLEDARARLAERVLEAHHIEEEDGR